LVRVAANVSDRGYSGAMSSSPCPLLPPLLPKLPLTPVGLLA